MKYDLPNRQQQ